eukprot:5509728-Pyramimonas_sp.AAC.1
MSRANARTLHAETSSEKCSGDRRGGGGGGEVQLNPRVRRSRARRGRGTPHGAVCRAPQLPPAAWDLQG